MTREQMVAGAKVKFHGGWDGIKERCVVCNFSCAYIMAGVIIERYKVWDPRSETFLPHPDLWTARLETGSYTSGYLDQFELDA